MQPKRIRPKTLLAGTVLVSVFGLGVFAASSLAQGTAGRDVSTDTGSTSIADSTTVDTATTVSTDTTSASTSTDTTTTTSPDTTTVLSTTTDATTSTDAATTTDLSTTTDTTTTTTATVPATTSDQPAPATVTTAAGTTTAQVTVSQLAVPDTTPPAEVGSPKAVAGDHVVTLAYTVPADADFAYVEVTRFGPGETPGPALKRATARARAAGTLVYRGRASRIVDGPLRNGVAYRYVLGTVDKVGNRSKGVAVAALPRSVRLESPADGTVVAAGSVFRWRTTAGADYYNVQLFRGSRKVLSSWPAANRFVLPRTWSYNGGRHTLAAGVYRWFVWAGYGPRTARRYSPVLGWSTFVVR
jgi:hypothetical protein